MNSRDCCLPLNTRNSMGTSGKVFEDQPAPEGSSPSFFMDPKNVASSSCKLRSGNTRNIMRHGEGSRREPQSSTMPTLRFTRKDETWNPLYHTGGTFFKNCMMEVPRCTISELHFGIFPDSGDFQCWRVNFKTEVCVSTPFLQLTMSWINEVEMSRSTDDLMMSQSIEGKSFPDFGMLVARITSALRKIIFNTS